MDATSVQYTSSTVSTGSYFRNPSLLSGSIRSNIRYFGLEASFSQRMARGVLLVAVGRRSGSTKGSFCRRANNFERSTFDNGSNKNFEALNGNSLR